MPIKLLSAAVVLLVGVALASLFPRTGDDSAAESAPPGVALRRDAPPSGGTQGTLVASTGAVPAASALPSFRAAVTHVKDDRAESELSSLASNSDRGTFRSPPPMPAEYLALSGTGRSHSTPGATKSATENPSPKQRREPRDDPPREVLHRIEDGDTLPSLAARYLGDAALASRIWEANQDRLPQNRNLLPIGVELRIPPRTAAPAPDDQLSRTGDLDGAITRLVPVERAPVVADAAAR